MGLIALFKTQKLREKRSWRFLIKVLQPNFIRYKSFYTYIILTLGIIMPKCSTFQMKTKIFR